MQKSLEQTARLHSKKANFDCSSVQYRVASEILLTLSHSDYKKKIFIHSDMHWDYNLPNDRVSLLKAHKNWICMTPTRILTPSNSSSFARIYVRLSIAIYSNKWILGWYCFIQHVWTTILNFEWVQFVLEANFSCKEAHSNTIYG